MKFGKHTPTEKAGEVTLLSQLLDRIATALEDLVKTAKAQNTITKNILALQERQIEINEEIWEENKEKDLSGLMLQQLIQAEHSRQKLNILGTPKGKHHEKNN